MWHVRGRRESHAGFWWEDLKDGGHSEHLCLDGTIILKQTLKVERERTWTEDKEQWRTAENTAKNPWVNCLWDFQYATIRVA
jgi:hypothetical protein